MDSDVDSGYTYSYRVSCSNDDQDSEFVFVEGVEIPVEETIEIIG